MRGNPAARPAAVPATGSIPACAGEPSAHGTRAIPPWVYPRVCGGTIFCAGSPSGRRGLSPRVRGNPVVCPPAQESVGSIPACAGEPGCAALGPARLKVYPRVCGGTFAGAGTTAIAAGLSPRVRGNPPQVSHSTASRGSIPACAGEPHLLAPRLQALPVYPRVCGGTIVWDKGGPGPGGLSPRVRGNRSAG